MTERGLRQLSAECVMRFQACTPREKGYSAARGKEHREHSGVDRGVVKHVIVRMWVVAGSSEGESEIRSM